MKYSHFLIVSFLLMIMSLSSCQMADQTLPPITKPAISLPDGCLTPEALWAMGRIGTFVFDIETGWSAYTVSYYSVEQNRSTSWIRICVEESDTLRTIDEFVGTDPAWFGNSGVLAYLRDGQLWLRQHGKDIPVRGFDRDIEGFLLSPHRDEVVLIASVKTHDTTAELYPDLPKSSGRVITDLMYKHWDEWVESAPQPFVCALHTHYRNEMDLSRVSVSDPRNILDGTPYECPMRPFGGVEQLCWHPNNRVLAYTCRCKSGLDYALSTNSDIYLYDMDSDATTTITASNHGYDTNPAYSPSGRYIAWQSMERDGYESDLNRLMVLDTETGQTTFLTRALDTNVDQYLWLNDSTILFNAVWHGTIMLYSVTLDGVITRLTEGQYDYVPMGWSYQGDSITYYCLRHSMRQANEVYAFRQGEEPRALTHENDNIFSQVEIGSVVPRWQTTTDGRQMLTWIIYPPHFDATKRYPTLLYCEGGPQSPVSQFWSFRWNFSLMSANDYIIVAPNRRGLPGFGSDWNEQISGDYTGQCMRDYLTAIDEFAAAEPYVDRDHLGCVGASFGGFSVYWLAGNHNHRFKAFIAHDGIFNMEMQYLETEEKWFANWDMGGPYWDKTNATAQRTFATSPHRYVDRWDTPILCIHGEKDYRILANQAMAAFDAAKMRGIPAELLIFPDENHWVLKPQNGILWQRTFFGWLDRWLKEDAQ